MIDLSDDLRQEAKRLLSLDEEGRRAEILAHSLSMRRASREASESLDRLNRESLQDLLKGGGSETPIDVEGTA